MLGVHFAVPPERERQLLAAADEDDTDALAGLLEDLEETWDDESLKVDSDKAWDAIHRCLTNGTLDPDAGEYPLSLAVLGGRHLHEDYYVVHVAADEVRDVAQALGGIDEPWLRARFDAIDDPDYAGARDDVDFDYTWSNFEDLQAFYERAAAAGRAVVFTAM